MVVDPLTFAASLSSLTGVTLSDVVAAATKCKRLAEITHRSLEVRNLLATLEEPDDLLVGYWQLASWEISSDTMSVPNRFVSGGLAVHFRERNTRSWRGTMCLSYKTRHGWWMKKEFTGEPAFVALYDVRFRAEERYFSGSSHMRQKNYFSWPHKLRARLSSQPSHVHAGIFSECIVSGDDGVRQFSGKFKNHTAGQKRKFSHFIFHTPLRWAEVASSPFPL